MAIARNAETGVTTKLSRAAMIEEGGGAPPPKTPPPTRAAAAAQPAALAAQAAIPLTAAFSPIITAAAVGPGTFVRPDLVFNPDFVPPRFTPPRNIQRTTTQIAQGAIMQLRSASAAVVGEAVTTINIKQIGGRDLMRTLERGVIIGEVLNELAREWSADTRQDFAKAFQMADTKTDVMDAIVSISILNDPDLPDELRDENVSDASGADLLENRRVVAQYPPPGTPLEAPYLVLVAVEYRDTRRADDIIQSITGDLVEHQGLKLPRTVAQNLR